MIKLGYGKIWPLEFNIYCLGLIVAGTIFLAHRPLAAEETDSQLNTTEIITLFQSSIDKVKDYQCILEEFAVFGTKKEEKRIYKYYFKYPDSVRMEILKGRMKGAVATFRDGKVKGRRAGFLSFLVLNLNLDDPRVTNIRGGRIDETSWYRILEIVLAYQENGEVKLIEKRQKRKRDTYVLELSSKGIPLSNDELIVREKLWIDAEEFIPLRIERYDVHGKVIHTLTYSHPVLNLGLSEELFEL